MQIIAQIEEGPAGLTFDSLAVWAAGVDPDGQAGVR